MFRYRVLNLARSLTSPPRRQPLMLGSENNSEQPSLAVADPSSGFELGGDARGRIEARLEASRFGRDLAANPLQVAKKLCGLALHVGRLRLTSSARVVFQDLS
jgi:hypothetical protein